MKKLLMAAAFCAALAGCVTVTNPMEGYTGPKVMVRDTAKVYSRSKADFFYVTAVNDKDIDDSAWATIRSNRGRGMDMEPVILDRALPAQKCSLTLAGRTTYAAPILALTNTVYEVKGKIDFIPQPDHVYVVHGELGESYSAVWLEDEATHEVVDKKIEIKGSASLGFFEK